MDLEITVTPRETLVWAPSAPTGQELRRALLDEGYLVLDADPFEVTSAGLIPEGEHLEFCLLYTSPSPRDVEESRMPSSA